MTMKQKRPSPDVLHIVLVKGDGGVGHMQFVTRQHPGKDEPGWTREATDAAIEAEIQRAGCEATEWHRVGPDAIPSDRTHRNAWVWDGQRIVVDESRIRRDPPSVEAPQAGAVQARDPRVDTLGQQLAGQFEVVAREMWAEVNKIREETLAEADRRILCTLEAIGVRSRAQAQGAIDLDAVPALARELRERGLPVDEQHIIAVADEHAARIYQRTAA